MRKPTVEELNAMLHYGEKRPLEPGEWFDQDAQHIDRLLDAMELNDQDWSKELGI